MNRVARQSAFTTVELALSLGIGVVLIASLLSMSLETSQFIVYSDADVTVQVEGSRAFTRMTDILCKTGRMEEDGVVYPRVVSGGAALEFRVLRDQDENGYAFVQGSGELEWDSRVFTLKADERGNLGVYVGGNVVYTLSRYITNMRFKTIDDDSSLHLKEIEVFYEARKPTDLGFDMVHSVKGGILMRN